MAYYEILQDMMALHKMTWYNWIGFNEISNSVDLISNNPQLQLVTISYDRVDILLEILTLNDSNIMECFMNSKLPRRWDN